MMMATTNHHPNTHSNCACHFNAYSQPDANAHGNFYNTPGHEHVNLFNTYYG